MMTNLFSIFDPATSNITDLNWLSCMCLFIIIPYNYWNSPSTYNMFYNNIMMYMYNEMKIIFKYKSISNILIFISIMIYIINMNFLGLNPYIFTPSSHLVISMTLSMPLWISFMLYSWHNYYMIILAHMVPSGTPDILMPFMVIIETISNLIRPMTLAIRLSANMIAGHLLMTLLGSTGSSLNILLIWIMLSAQTMLMILEMSVALIQSYVFTILSSLYSNEI